MHSSITFAALLAATQAGTALAKTIQIDVGKSGLVFSPDTSTADVGDTLEFHFYSGFHTAVQGDFSTACQRGSLASSGFNSGPVNNKADGTPSVFQVTVKDTKPIWFYCSTPSHCESGMAGVVNPPSSGPNTLDAYKSAAASASSSEGSTTVAGGQIVPVGTKPSAAPGSSSSSAASSAAPASSSPSTETPTSTAESSSAASGASSAASGASSAAPTTTSSAKPSATTAATSGASAPNGFMGFAAQGMWAAVAVGVGMVGYLMA